MSRADDKALLLSIAPAAPPCFESRLQWLGWLVGAHEAHRSPVTSPLRRTADGTSFNHEINFCGDCARAYRVEMKQGGRCKPAHLLERAVTA